MNLSSTGATNTLGATSTQQFDPLSANVGAIPANVRGGGSVTAPNVAAGGIGRTLRDTPAAFGFSDLLNVFLFSPDLNIGAEIKALQSRDIIQVLEKPYVLTTNGTVAS